MTRFDHTAAAIAVLALAQGTALVWMWLTLPKMTHAAALVGKIIAKLPF